MSSWRGFVSRALGVAGVVLACAGLPGDHARHASANHVQSASSVERASLSVTLSNADGARARLYVSAPEGTHLEAERAVREGVTTFEDAPVGRAWLVIDAPGKARHTQEIVLDPGPNTANVSVLAGRALDVLVVEESGAPARGAWVQSASDGAMPVRARTDETGHAHLEGLLLQMTHVEASIAGVAEGDAWAAPGANELRLHVRAMGRVRVRVTAADGTPAPGASVDVVGTRLWPMRTTLTQKEGRVDVRGLRAGMFWVRAHLGASISAVVSVDLKAGDEPELNLAMIAGTLIDVACTDEQGAAVRDAALTLTPEGLSLFPEEAHTDARGAARMGPFLPGNISISANTGGYVPAMMSMQVEPAMAQKRVRVVMQRGGRVRVVVQDSAHRGIAGARIELVGRNEQGVPYTRGSERTVFQGALFERQARPASFFPVGDLGVVPGPVPAITQSLQTIDRVANAGSSLSAITDREGVLMLDAVPVGEVRARVFHPDYSEGMSAPQQVAARGTAALWVELHRGGTVQGRLVDAAGRAAPGYEIRLVGEGMQSRTSDEAGQFEFRNVSARAVFTVQDPAEPTHGLLRSEVDVPEGKSTSIVLTLPEQGAPLHVRVLDMSGRPIAMAEVRAVSLDASIPRRVTEFTGNDGYAHLHRFRTLESRLDVEAPGHAPRTLYTDTRTTEGVIKLAAALTLQGRVYSASGNAVAGARVELHQGARTMMALSDAAGAFHVGGVAAEKLTWRVTASGFNALSGSRDLRTRAGKVDAELSKIELQREACVAGMVRDAEGHIAPGARVVTGVPHRYRPADLQTESAVVDASGSYRLCGAGLGSVLLRPVREGDVDGATHAVKLGSGDTVVGVDLRLGPKDKAPREAEHGGLAITLGEDSNQSAVMLVRVFPGSTAERAGLLTGDIVLRIDGHEIRTLEDARARMSGTVGDELVLHVERDGALVAMRVTRELVRR